MFNITQNAVVYRAEAMPFRDELQRLYNMRESLRPRKMARTEINDAQEERNRPLFRSNRAQLAVLADPRAVERIEALDRLKAAVEPYLNSNSADALKAIQYAVKESVKASNFSDEHGANVWHYNLKRQYGKVLDTLQLAIDSKLNDKDGQNTEHALMSASWCDEETSIPSTIGRDRGDATSSAHSTLAAPPTQDDTTDWRSKMITGCLRQLLPLLKVMLDSITKDRRRNSRPMILIEHWGNTVGFEVQAAWPTSKAEVKKLGQLCKELLNLHDGEAIGIAWYKWMPHACDKAYCRAACRVIRQGLTILKGFAESAADGEDTESAMAPTARSFTAPGMQGSNSAGVDSVFVSTSSAYSYFERYVQELQSKSSQ